MLETEAREREREREKEGVKGEGDRSCLSTGIKFQLYRMESEDLLGTIAPIVDSTVLGTGNIFRRVRAHVKCS